MEYIRINSCRGIVTFAKNSCFVFVPNYLFLNPLTGLRRSFSRICFPFVFFHCYDSPSLLPPLFRWNKCLPSNKVSYYRVVYQIVRFFTNVTETIQPIANVEFDCRLQKERRILCFSLEIIAQLKR